MDLHEIFYPNEEVISTETSYLDDLPRYLGMLETITGMSSGSYCFLDYVRGSLLYISDHERILCGYTVDEVKEMGILFFEKIIDQDDFEELNIKISTGCDFYNNLSQNERFTQYFVHDFNIIAKDGQKLIKKFIFKPVCTDSKGKLQLALIKVIDIGRKGITDYFVLSVKDKSKYEFKPDKQRYTKKHKTQLNEQEKIVLGWWMMGDKVGDISKRTGIELGTCKFYLKSICRKTNAKNMQQAICIILQTGDLYL